MNRPDKELIFALVEAHPELHDTRSQDSWTPLHLVARGGRTDLVGLLLQNGADVNAKGWNAATPLHWAANNGHIQVVKLLLTKGAQINAKTDEDLTPLTFALRGGHEDIAALLRSHGACEE
jgi:ankyrin repeat protein